ncbi:MAG: RecX family transcriptional regulator, partial [Flavobacteriales bacterium]|nr:RecX family transcriptional regulator [Flavobacteriales bacterium]
LESIRELAQYKMERVKGKDEREKKSKVFRYLQQKGYESDIIYQVLFTQK